MTLLLSGSAVSYSSELVLVQAGYWVSWLGGRDCLLLPHIFSTTQPWKNYILSSYLNDPKWMRKHRAVRLGIRTCALLFTRRELYRHAIKSLLISSFKVAYKSYIMFNTRTGMVFEQIHTGRHRPMTNGYKFFTNNITMETSLCCLASRPMCRPASVNSVKENFVEKLSGFFQLRRMCVWYAHVDIHIDRYYRLSKLKWKWAGHIGWRTVERWTLKALNWYSGGSSGIVRQLGRPQTRWADNIRE